jgi:hypothetical protein
MWTFRDLQLRFMRLEREFRGRPRWRIEWQRFAVVLSWVFEPIWFSLFYFLIFAPFAMISRIFRADPMRRSFSKESTYWIPALRAHDDKKPY